MIAPRWALGEAERLTFPARLERDSPAPATGRGGRGVMAPRRDQPARWRGTDMSDRMAELEARVRRMEDLEEIRQLFVDYGHYLDARDAEAYANLFAREGE